MSGTSPAATLFNSAGIELAVSTGQVLPVGTALVMAGGTVDGYAQPLKVDGYGRQVIISDPASPLAITGSITATNPSVSTTGTAPPASATYLGGSVTTAPPTYTTGQMSALSLTTTGALRVAGSVADATASATLNVGSQTLTMALSGQSSVGCKSNTVGYSGYLALLISMDGGSTFVESGTVRELPSYKRVGTDWDTGSNILSSDTTERYWVLDIPPGATHVRFWAEGITGGSVGVILTATARPFQWPITAYRQGDFIGSTATANMNAMTVIGGIDTVNGSYQRMSISEAGELPTAAIQMSDYYPGPYSTPTGGYQGLSVDIWGSLQTRGPTFTDEGSLFDAFVGSSLFTALTGTLTFTNGSKLVTGAGTAFRTEVSWQMFVHLNADAQSAWAGVDYVQDDTTLYLQAPYTGTGGSGASQRSLWDPETAGGGAIAVASSLCTLTATGANGDIARIYTKGDVQPLTTNDRVTVSQRVANQNIRIGFVDGVSPATPEHGAYFLFDGTTNTTVKCVVRASSSASDATITTITYPSAGTSATQHQYSILLRGDVVTFMVDNIVVASIQSHMPTSTDVLNMVIDVVNTGATTTGTTVSIDSAGVIIYNRMDADIYQPIPSLLQATVHGPVLTAAAVAGYNPVLVGGTDGTNARMLSVDANGGVRLANWLGSTAPTVGSKTSANSIPVVVASDQAAIAVKGVSAALADNTSNTVVNLPTQSFLMGFDGSTWDRARVGANSNDAVGSIATGIQETNSYSMGWNGTTWDRLRSTTANGLAVDVTRVQGTVTVGGINANGGGITGNPVRIGGSSGAATYDIKCDTSGNLYMQGMGTAGSASGGVLTVQGSASGTPIPVSGTFSGAITPADAFANPTTAQTGWSLQAGFNGTTWDRVRSGATNADGVASLTLGAQSTQGFLFGYNGTTWDRVRIKAASTAAVAADPAVVVAVSPNNIVPVSQATLATGNALATASMTTASSAIVASNANRKRLILRNTSTTTSVYIAFGQTATTNAPFVLNPGQRYIEDTGVFTGAINGITASGTATIAVQELQS